MTEDPNCGNCPYWRGRECTRFPPVIVTPPVYGKPSHSEWPRTHETDICGEHPHHPARDRSISPWITP